MTVLAVAAWAVAGEVMRGLDAATFAALVGAGVREEGSGPFAPAPLPA